MNTKAYLRLFIAAGLACFITAMATTRLGHNLLWMVVSRDFFIPHESSIFTFKPTEWFTVGSGDWCSYGEDAKYYYYFKPDSDPEMESLPKSRAISIPGFSSTDRLTWSILEPSHGTKTLPPTAPLRE